MRLLVVAVCLLAGCDQVFGILPVSDGNDATIDNAPGCVANGLLMNLCPPDGILVLRTVVGPIDTTACTNGEISGDLCILWGTDVDVMQSSATGDRLLVIAATQSLTIDGPLDVGGHASSAGPNAKLACASPAIAGGNGTSAGSPYGGGGAGGCGSGVGGRGGSSGGVIPGGVACSSVVELALRGGCSGSAGGDAFNNTNHGNGGGGGGAVYLIGGASITLRGDVLAGGGGGVGAPGSGGAGGGGGAGGLIAFDTPVFTVMPVGATPRLCANGGGGGGGAGTTGAAIGMSGHDGCTADNGAALGGAGGSPGGGNGGDGGAASRSGVNAAAGAVAGGGGGGGAAGLIGMYGDDTTKLAQAMTSPMESF